MPKIQYSTEIDATRDRVWEIISDLENEPEFWYGTREVRTISKSGNTVQREITQNFRNHKIMQEAILHPKDSLEVKYLRGMTMGKKTLTIEPIAENRQRLSAVWDIHFAGLLKLLSPWIGSHTRRGTIHALERIKSAAEGKEQTLSPEKREVNT